MCSYALRTFTIACALGEAAGRLDGLGSKEGKGGE